MAETVEERWRALLARGEPETREVDAASPLRMLIGVSPVGRPYFAVIVSQKPGLPDLTSAIEVTRRQRTTDARWTLTLELQVPSLTDAFISLVSDLAAKSATASSERGALATFLETLAEWQELLTARSEHLSESGLRGLVAELWFGFASEAHDQPLPEVTRAWAGPFGGAQDFQFPPPSHHFEVKSVRPNRTTVEISSEDQLDGPGVKLAIVTVEEVADSLEGITLPRLVASIRSCLKNGADRSEFNRRFARLFIDPDDPWYSEHAYAVRHLQVLNVSDEFPALRRSQLPDAIARTNYRVDIQYLSNFVELDIDYSHESGVRDG
jgi:Putative  PD-(D/E)XK family member, (DUF4420)